MESPLWGAARAAGPFVGVMLERDWRLPSTAWFRRFRRFTRAASRPRNCRGVQRCREKDSDRGRGYRSEFSATGEKPPAVLVSAHVQNLVVVHHFPLRNLPSIDELMLHGLPCSAATPKWGYARKQNERPQRTGSRYPGRQLYNSWRNARAGRRAGAAALQQHAAGI
jgi:hypothetical protein